MPKTWYQIGLFGALLVAALCGHAPAALALQSNFGVHVGFDDGPNTYVYCSPFNITPDVVSGTDAVTVRFRRFTSDGSITNNVITPKAVNIARLVCSNRSGGTTTVQGFPGDRSKAVCPAAFPIGKFAECAVNVDSAVVKTPFVYRGTACGDGIRSVSNGFLYGQETGNSTTTTKMDDGHGNKTDVFFNDTVAQAKVTGTDIGAPFFSNFSMYFLFGDTNLTGDREIHGTYARSSQIEPLPNFSGITFNDWYGGSTAKQLLPNRPQDDVCGNNRGSLPNSGWALTQGANTFKYFFFTSIASWWYNPITDDWCDDPNDPDGDATLQLRVHGGSIAFSMNDGPWHRLDESHSVFWPQSSHFTYAGAYHQIIGSGSGYVYLFGVSLDKNEPLSNSSVRLMRVPAVHSSIVNPQAYRYWNGSSWVADQNAAVDIVPASKHIRELSVAFNSYANRYVMLGAADKLLQAPELTGPWTEVPGTTGAFLGTYGWATHDRFMTRQGRDIHFLGSETWPVYQVGSWRAMINRNTIPGCVPDQQ